MFLPSFIDIILTLAPYESIGYKLIISKVPQHCGIIYNFFYYTDSLKYNINGSTYNYS